MSLHKILDKKSLNVIQETCFEAIEKYDVNCNRKKCKQWINHEKGKNCTFVTTKQGPLTLREIGKIYDLTRMRICQIEKSIYSKIRNFIS